MEECKLSISSKARVPPLRTPIGKDQFLFKISLNLKLEMEQNSKNGLKSEKWRQPNVSKYSKSKNR